MNLNKEDIRLLLKDIPTIDDQLELSFKYLNNGITNENYWLKLGNDEYVLRINNPDAKILGIDHAAELLILNKVSKLNIAIKPLYNDIENKIRLSHWQKGRPWHVDDLDKPIQLNRFAERLKQLHKMPSQGLPVLDFIQRVDCYRSLIINRRGKLSNLEERLLLRAVELITSIQHSLPSVLCHNDLVIANILETDVIVFLDWEYAAVTHPLFELAVFCRGNNISKTNKEYLLSAYLTPDISYMMSNEFEKWCWLYDYLSFLWGIAILPMDIALPDNINLLSEQLMNNLPNQSTE